MKHQFKFKKNCLTEVVRRAQSGEDTGEELQSDLDLSAVTVPEHNTEL